MALPRFPAFLTRALAAVALFATVPCVLLGAALAFGTSAAPPPLKQSVAQFKQVDYSDLPATRRFEARDGAQLAYRVYPGTGPDVVVMLHGAALSGFALHVLAKRVAEAGFTVYVPDIRGHGGSGPLGDIAYSGQLLDDLADLARLVRRAHPAATVSLVGHSAGGCLALRFAGSANGGLFDSVVLISPMLSRDAPTVRPGIAGFAKPFKARYVALAILDRLGVRAWQSLPVLAFAVPADPDGKTVPLYSYRLSEAFTQDRAYLDDLRRIKMPTRIFIGSDDELFFPQRLGPLVHSLRPDIPVNVIDAAGHAGIVLDSRVAGAVTDALRGSVATRKVSQ